MIQPLPETASRRLRWSHEEVQQLQAMGMFTESPAPQRSWSRREYQQLVAAGLLEQKHVELLQGELIVMHPMGSRHYSAVRRCDKVLSTAFGDGYTVRMQATLDLGDDQPEPDVAVVLGSDDDYIDHHPTTALLVVEEAETSLVTDRHLKASLYAAAGIAEYWIVNLIARQIEVHRRPIVAASEPYGYLYGDMQTFSGDEEFVIPATQQRLTVTALLPA